MNTIDAIHSQAMQLSQTDRALLASEVIVLAVPHARRRPFYWIDRRD